MVGIKIGKIGKLNQKEARELKKLWIEKDVRWCEYPYRHNCNFNMFPTNAHRHKKRDYRGKPDHMRWSYNQVIRICESSHSEIEYNALLTEKIFEELRGEDEL